MSKNTNVIEEIQELIKKIKTEYQEGVDFKIISSKEKFLLRREVLMIKILSPRLKRDCRDLIGFPTHFPDGLSYYQGNQEQEPNQNWFFYQTEQEVEGAKCDSFIFCEGIEASGSRARGGFENCDLCGEPVDKKKGRMEQWDQARNILVRFHSVCAKKYFADKEQPKENNNTRIKEKLLRNLDKLCFDPNGYLANNEHLKTDGAEEEYHQLFSSSRWGQPWKNRYLKITIEGEEIDLEDWDNTCPEYYEVKRELIKKIKSEIKKNPSEWKIEKGKEENYADESNNRLIKHVSGQRHWKYAISYLWGGNSSERIKHWAEIEALINGSTLPDSNKKDQDNSLSDTEKEQIKQFFLKNDIKEIKFEDGKLIITHNNNNNNETKDRKEIFHDPELLKLMEYCQKSKENKVNKEDLNIGSSNNTSVSDKTPWWENKYVWLVGGVSIGVVIVVIIIALLPSKKEIDKK